MSLAELELKAKAFADAREELSQAMKALHKEVEALRRKAMPRIKSLVARTAEHHLDLESSIEINRLLFRSPRTIIFHGIKCGLAKGKGSIDWEDDARVCELIEKHYPHLKETAIKTTKKPVVKVLRGLSVTDLQKIGCIVEATGDVIVIHPVDDKVEKAVEALLAEAVSDETQFEQEAA